MADDKRQMVGERMESFEKRMEAAEKKVEAAEKRAEETQNKLDKMEGEYGPDRSGTKMTPISQEQVAARAKKYRNRGPDRYEARDADGKIVGKGYRPDSLRDIAQARSAGRYPSTDDENRRTIATDGPRQEVTVTRIFGNTGKTAVVGTYVDGKLVEKK